MIPHLITVKILRTNRRTIRIWVPVLPVLLILSPVLILATAAAAIACLIYRISVLRALGAGWRIMSALRGLRLDVEHGPTAFLVTIR